MVVAAFVQADSSRIVFCEFRIVFWNSHPSPVLHARPAWVYGFCMGFGRASLTPVDDRPLADLRRSGVVRAGAEPLPVPETVASGDPLLAAFLPGGGFPCGHITEIRGTPSSGRLSITIRAILRALALGQRPALVTTRGFFPGLVPWLPAALDATLVCRVADLAEGLGAAEVLATAGAVDLLVLDAVGLAGDGRPAGADASLARLERAARAERLALVLLTDERSAATIGLGAKPSLRIELHAAASGVPDGRFVVHPSIVRSRFARPASSAPPSAPESVPIARRGPAW